MKTKLAIVAVFFVIAGFGMIHAPSPVLEYIAIALMGMGTSYLLYLLLAPGNKRDEPGLGE
ncbi:MAG: hypothetical protein ACOCTO_01235 [Marinilabiliaceae bacterium]